MFITLPQKTNNPDLERAHIKLQARRAIYLWHYTPRDILLNKYLTENYNITLKIACIGIIMSCMVGSNSNGEMIVTIPDKKLDKLATLITYGNEKIKGSNILKVALTMTKGDRHGL